MDETGFVFTNAIGERLEAHTVYKNFKTILRSFGMTTQDFTICATQRSRKHQTGDDIKTVQEHLGHATASFTLAVYGHVTDQIKRDSAARMETFIRTVSQ